MLELFARPNRRRIAILQNAYGITEEQHLNKLGYLNFSLPYDDKKNDLCQPFAYVRYNDGELYRIMPRTRQLDEAGNCAYTCEHVLATLMDKVMYGYHIVGNLGVYTADCINYVLSQQLTEDWILWECDFRRQFEYGWEQENLLSALFSIATPLSDYMWVTDTSVYPWRVSLKALESGLPELYVRRKRNMLSFADETDPTQICTRLYPLGYGEGVNQLGIAAVNNGVPYLQSPQQYIDRYGIIERVWIDRRYENAESLKAAAQTMLDSLQELAVAYDIGFAELDTHDWERAAIGKRTRIICPELQVNTDTRITDITWDHDAKENSTFTVANKPADIASSVAELADRQRIESAYAQGATQLYAQSIQGNCSPTDPLKLDFYIPAEMRIINKVLLRSRTERFRAYSQATEQAARSVYTSSSGGGTSPTTSSGGGSSPTTSSGGGSSESSSSAGSASLTVSTGVNVEYGYAWTTNVDGHAHEVRLVTGHQHRLDISSHRHTVDIPAHTHSVNIPSHTHSVNIPSHTHTVDIPAHAHQITPGIFRFGGATSYGIWVNGHLKLTINGTSSDEIDISAYLITDGVTPRGTWHNVEIRPNALAYGTITVFVQGFMQSRGGLVA